MRLVSYLTLAGQPSVGVVDPGGGGVHDLARLVGPVGGLSPMRRLLAATAGDLAASAEAAADTPLLAWSEIVLQPPVPDPSKIVAPPVNYRDHQAEMQQSTAIEAFGLFLKAPSSLLADGGTVRLPYTTAASTRRPSSGWSSAGRPATSTPPTRFRTSPATRACWT